MFNNEWKLDLTSKTFDVLDLELFKNYRFKTLFNYVVVFWGLTILKVVLFGSDIYTCIKLLAFNSWSNNIIKPYLSFRISKWLFSGCILASIVLMIWEVVNGVRIYRSRNIALTYVNNFSRAVYSISQYNIFCVYNRITPKGSYERIAFYTFFEFKDCLRLLLTDTPRQVINGLTLWSVLVTNNDGANLAELENFNGLITKIKIIAQTNHEEAVLLSFMFLSFCIWAIFITKLMVAAIFAPFVYHKIFNQYNMRGLKEFVCTTVNRRVDDLVEKYKWKKDQKIALEKGLINAYTVPFFDDLERNSTFGVDQPLRLFSTTNINSTTDSLTKNTVPVPFTSIINKEANKSVDNFPLRTVLLSKASTFDSKLSVETAGLPVTNPYYYQNRNDTTNSLGSNMTEQRTTSDNTIPGYRRNFVKQLALGTAETAGNNSHRNNSNTNNININTNTNDNDYDRSESNSGDDLEDDEEVAIRSPLIPANSLNHYVTTPDKAYFHSDVFLPERTTSILDRRQRMEEQDYGLYADRFYNGRGRV